MKAPLKFVSKNITCLELIEIHEGSTKVHEGSFKMLAYENCNDMYSRLNVIVKDINALEISKIDSGSM